MKSGQIWLLLIAFIILLGPVARAQEITGVFSHSVNLFELSGGVMFGF